MEIELGRDTEENKIQSVPFGTRSKAVSTSLRDTRRKTNHHSLKAAVDDNHNPVSLSNSINERELLRNIEVPVHKARIAVQSPWPPPATVYNFKISSLRDRMERFFYHNCCIVKENELAL